LFLARRMRDAQRARERRARLTPEQIAQQRHRDAVLKRQKRAKETEAEKAIRRSLEAQKARERRAKMLGKKQGFTSICSAAASRMGLTHFVSCNTKTEDMHALSIDMVDKMLQSVSGNNILNSKGKACRNSLVIHIVKNIFHLCIFNVIIAIQY